MAGVSSSQRHSIGMPKLVPAHMQRSSAQAQKSATDRRAKQSMINAGKQVVEEYEKDGDVEMAKMAQAILDAQKKSLDFESSSGSGNSQDLVMR